MSAGQADTENENVDYNIDASTVNENKNKDNTDIDIEIKVSKGDLNNLHKEDTSSNNDKTNPLSNILDDHDEELHAETSGDIDVDTPILKVKTTDNHTNNPAVNGESTNKSNGHHGHHDHHMADYHTDDDYSHHASSNISNNDHHGQHMDTMRWFRMGTDRSQTPDVSTTSKDGHHTHTHHKSPHDTMYDLNHMPTQDEQYEDFILHLRHAASYKAEYDIYQVLAYRAKVSVGQKVYFKPFKSLRGMISEEWSQLEVRWLNSFQRVLCQAVVCMSIQTLGVTAILITQFAAYFDDAADNAQCDYHAARWASDWHLKLLAFLWTAFISLGVSGWVYRARHSGFYPILLFLRRDQYPNFVSITILQLGLLANYYVVTSSVIGSYILIYQTEGGTETIGMILQAVALFFVLELDNKIVHSRDFLSIRKYFDAYIKNNKHKKIPKAALREKENIFQKPRKKCKGNSCLGGTLSIVTFMLLVIMTIGAFIAPWLIMICW